MKKTISLLLIVSMLAICFAGCGKEAVENMQETEQNSPISTDGQKPIEPANDNNGESNTPEETSPTPVKPSTTPEKPSTAPEKPSTTPEKPSTTPQGTVKPEQKPSTQKKYSIFEVHKLVKETYGEDYRPNVDIPEDALTSMFGIDLNIVEEHIAEQPMISANIDTFIAIKAKSGKAAEIETALLNYKKELTAGAAIYPSNIPKAQAGQVVRHGDYVFFVMLGAAGDIEGAEEEQIKFANEQVKKGVSAINNYFAK